MKIILLILASYFVPYLLLASLIGGMILYWSTVGTIVIIASLYSIREENKRNIALTKVSKIDPVKALEKYIKEVKSKYENSME